jgi:diaminopimelate decarboxylase
MSKATGTGGTGENMRRTEEKNKQTKGVNRRRGTGYFMIRKECSLVGSYMCFRGTCCFHLPREKIGDSMFFGNTGSYVLNYMSSQPRTP